MLVETSLRELAMADIASGARLAETLGYDGLTFSEVRQDPFIVASLAATATEKVQLATSVAIAFPRSPMIAAYATRNLQDLSHGRFSLGLGTQVRGHIQRRFSAEWDSPGPRLREYVHALRAIWSCWQDGTPLDMHGRFYNFTLMTPEFSLGPGPYPTRVHLAAVNPYNIATAATLCDCLRVHSFCTPEYLRDVIWPTVTSAAAAAGRSLDGFEMLGCGFLVAGATPDDVHMAREQVRRRVAFYASTRAYAPVLEHHGWHQLGPTLRELIARGQWADLARHVDDTVLNAFCIAGTYAELPGRVQARLEGLIDRVSLPLPHDATRDAARLAATIADLHTLATAREQRSPGAVAGV
jgi:probable F420-dependent oxidoreductase